VRRRPRSSAAVQAGWRRSALVEGLAHGDDRQALTQALRPSLPQARHDLDPPSRGVGQACIGRANCCDISISPKAGSR
jgi:hypothetical protein